MLEYPDSPPETSISLVGSIDSDAFVYKKIPMSGNDYRLHSACVVHKKTSTLYIFGGYKKGKWVAICNKVPFKELML